MPNTRARADGAIDSRAPENLVSENPAPETSDAEWLNSLVGLHSVRAATTPSTVAWNSG